VHIPVPSGTSFLSPVGAIARLYKKMGGNQGVAVAEAPAMLDVAATRNKQSLFLHVLNTSYTQEAKPDIALTTGEITGARLCQIAPAEPRAYVDRDNRNTFDPVITELSLEQLSHVTLPPTSVSIIELKMA